MTILRALTILLLLGSSALAQAVADWDFAGESHDIKVWTRTIPGAPLKDFRGVMDVDMPLAAVIAAVSDVPTYPEWFFQMREARIVSGGSMDSVRVYFVIAGIWPVSDRDAVIKASVVQDPATLAVHMLADAEPGFLQKVAGRVRMPAMHSGWTLTPLSPTRTRVELIGNADPGGWIPLWLANSVVTMMPKETLKRLRVQMQAAKYRDAEALFARDPLLRDLRAHIRLP